MIRINLLPTKKAVKISPTLIYGAIGTVVLVVLVTVFSLYLVNKVSGLKKEAAAKEKTLTDLKQKVKEVQNYESNNEEVRKKAAIIEQLKKNQALPLRLLDELSDMIPKGVWLTSLSEKAGAVSIEGLAHTNYDLVGYVQSLKNSKYFSDVTLIESRQTMIDTHELYKFKMTFNIRI